MANRLPAGFLKNPIHLIALGFGTGVSAKAPGTVGTLVGIPIFLMLHQLPLAVYLLSVVALFALGVLVSDITAKALGQGDPGCIVWDEVVGYLVTMVAMPAEAVWIVAGFIAFRFFDIIKPWPIRWFDKRCKGGFGIMIDDIVAGLFGWLVLWIVGLVVA
jgi:phosphatidylglycerophosphatase A